MANAAVARFVELLVQSQLLENGQREEVARLQDQCADARGLAQELVRREWLTPFQVYQLAQGKGATLVLGQYLLLDRLGEGAMGQVFRAKQRSLQRIVAVKVIRKECMSNPRLIERFKREMLIAGQLSHPNIVRAYDADQVNGTYFIAMEFIDGVDLSQLVHHNGPLSVAQACAYIRQAAVGLDHAHERGLVHRDIKPANLLITHERSQRSSALLKRPAKGARKQSAAFARPVKADNPWGIVKILDMGLARLTDPDNGYLASNITQLGALMGTPEYIAPEQARDCRVSDIRADLYSLGCTFYFLLSGQCPYPNGTLTEKLLQHQYEEAEAVDEVRRTRILAALGKRNQVPRSALVVPDEVKAVVRLLMAKRPEDRIQTPGELAAILAGIEADLPKSIKSAGPVASHSTRRNPAASSSQPLKAEMRKDRAATSPADLTVAYEPGVRAPAIAPIITLPSRNGVSRKRPSRPRMSKAESINAGARKADSDKKDSRKRASKWAAAVGWRVVSVALVMGVILLGMLLSGLGRSRPQAGAMPAEDKAPAKSKPG
ncbi:MAG: serine/threonine protein kinase [Planctomycetes bacterium]|nr:serine/threonine protein kinase [Planctomycetota bacterium]